MYSLSLSLLFFLLLLGGCPHFFKFIQRCKKVQTSSLQPFFLCKVARRRRRWSLLWRQHKKICETGDRERGGGEEKELPYPAGGLWEGDTKISRPQTPNTTQLNCILKRNQGCSICTRRNNGEKRQLFLLIVFSSIIFRHENPQVFLPVLALPHLSLSFSPFPPAQKHFFLSPPRDEERGMALPLRWKKNILYLLGLERERERKKWLVSIYDPPSSPFPPLPPQQKSSSFFLSFPFLLLQ